MMSISAYIALYQIIVKPHYWEKTQHGTHLAPATRAQVHGLLPVLEPEGYAVAASMPTTRLFAVTIGRVFKRAAPANTLETPTQQVTALRSTLSAQLGQRKVRRQLHLPHIRDRWLLATLIIAVVVSIASTWYVFQHHWTLAYNDAFSHIVIARSVLDSITPGLAQLGGVWLPLPHVLIALFVWNDYLWQSGLAGSIVGIGSYLVAMIYIFLAARRLTRNSCASFIGTLVYVLNPNVLYLQATPLTEPVCQATFAMACYYSLAWVQEDRRKYLLLATASTFLATLSRYDGWVLIAVFPALISITGALKHQSLRKIEGNLVTFIALGSLGIVLWLVWGEIIFHDPLYFQHSAFSSQQQFLALLQRTEHGNLPLDIQLYTIDTVETLGLGLFLLALIAILLFVYRRWNALDTLAVLAFLSPFVFYIVALYGGQVTLFDSRATFYPLGIIPISESGHLFNSRFGSEMVAPAAIFIATLVPIWSKATPFFQRWGKLLARGLLLLMIVLQSAWVAYGGVISIIAETNPPFCAFGYPLNVYLAEHYNGGRILQAEYPFHLSESEAGIHFSNIVYEGSASLWAQALQHPETSVDWVIFSPGDSVAEAMARAGHRFIQDFTLVVTGPNGLRLYHRNGLPPLPTRSPSSYLLSEQQFCTASNYKYYGDRFTMPLSLQMYLGSPGVLDKRPLHLSSSYQRERES
jgi:hypothetical protein